MTYKARLKIVPDASPKADGDWIEVECDDKFVEILKTARSFNTTVELFASRIPLEYHVVQIDLKCIMELRAATITLRFVDDE